MGGEAFRQARDFLFAHRGDYAGAHRGFRWPEHGAFNWALDWFDAELARGPLGNTDALRIVGDGAAEPQLRPALGRSNRLANWLRALGVKRGDRILLMLGNVVPLWETMLAAMKLGAVVIPATTLLDAGRPADRLERGRVAPRRRRRAPMRRNSTASTRRVTRIAVGGAAPAGRDYADADARQRRASRPTGATHADDPLLLYFTSGTTAKPKLVLHNQQQLPGRPPVDDVLARPAARRRAPQHLLARAGPSTPGAASSRPGTPAPRCSSTTSRASTRTALLDAHRRAAASPPSARRRRCGAC